ncbi:restriction endonuclease subunit S [Anaerocolumna sp. AGMB13020]|uniref:restriction endonuclease subunit S n=1 Tax=Anaerocolumna sp. AGMB13020 TaxID=3081750 RepID=UPI0029530484|nr:restriction endonuclease subunit S [Anaerocolumna sp. AGMB13020]WOO34809.1 restriction endonuclease subunit S [Anaerocolumna sp. AGMB13020]
MKFDETWKEVELGQLLNFKRGHDLPKTSMNGGEIPVVGSNGIIGYHDIYTTESPCLTIGRSGNIGKPYIVEKNCWAHNTTLYVDDFKGNDPFYLYYLLKTMKLSFYGGGSAVPTLNRNHIHPIKVFATFNTKIQKSIAKLLKDFDMKIELNNQINDNLLEQVMALFKNIFVESKTEHKICKADEYFKISIGKTPPRKEQEWFSTDSQNIRWVSISDMGSSGVFISDSSEYLTHEAVNKFNVVIIPDNTVLVSFKLTVGRIAITDGVMTTNEAIAHFKSSNMEINPYLYCYLKNFNFQSLGSTSSIATAVNSKIIKGMPFIIPKDDELRQFNEVAFPAFSMIKANQAETKNLTQLRDTILPKLMSGELDVSAIVH